MCRSAHAAAAAAEPSRPTVKGPKMADNTALFLRPKTAAERVSLSVASINRALARGELTRRKRGAATLIAVDELDAWARGESLAQDDSRA
jgi:hypothetical protein